MSPNITSHIGMGLHVSEIIYPSIALQLVHQGPFFYPVFVMLPHPQKPSQIHLLVAKKIWKYKREQYFLVLDPVPLKDLPTH